MHKVKNPYYDRSKHHHTPHGFRNNHEHEHPAAWATLRWMIKGLPKRWYNHFQKPLDIVKPDVGFLQSNRKQTTVTWLGHATVLLQTAGMNILFDPFFGGRASPLPFFGPRRHHALPMRMDELPEIDVVVISHNHYDHLSLPVVRYLYQRGRGRTHFMLPLGVEHWFAKNVSKGEMECLHVFDWWENIKHQGVEFHFVPVQHWSVRTFWDRNTTLWGGWVVSQPDFNFFFSGDLGFSADVEEIGKRFSGFDLAAIAIGSYEARWMMKAHHVNPAEAVKVHQLIKAKRSFGIHWGTLSCISDEPLDQPPQELAKACQMAGLATGEFSAPLPGSSIYR